MDEVLDSQPESGVAGEDGTRADDAAHALETVTAERDRLRQEKDELWDRFVRKQAEFENFRRRTIREREEVLQFAAMETVRALLPVLDDFERAMRAPAAGDEYRKGIELIHKRLYDTLVQAGLSPIETANRKFDPNCHQAVDTLKTTDGEDQAIVEEYQKGYEFKGRLLRPAMVKVAIRE